MIETGLLAIQKFCEKKIGLNSQLISSAAWQRIIQERSNRVAAKDSQSYYYRILEDGSEFQNLIESLIVSETWFFRDYQAIEFLMTYYKKYWVKQYKRAIRILCLPCASGEEPYSIVMTYLAAYIKSAAFLIDGIDISRKAVDKAKSGIYTSNSFRGRKLEFCQAHFTKDASHHFILSKEIQALVNFRVANVCDPDFLKCCHKKYDVIFCRYLFMYMNQAAQSHLFNAITQLLQPNGLLFVASAEVELARRHNFFLTNPPSACALTFNHLTKNYAPSLPLEKKLEKIKISNPVEEYTIEKVKALADKGLFKEAKEACQTYLKRQGPDPEIYYLLALIEHASDQLEQAKVCLQKAIYLKPDYYEALICLSLFMKGEGKIEEANLYQERAIRLDKKIGNSN